MAKMCEPPLPKGIPAGKSPPYEGGDFFSSPNKTSLKSLNYDNFTFLNLSFAKNRAIINVIITIPNSTIAAAHPILCHCSYGLIARL